MNRQIALFRGINVGGYNIIKMTELKSILESIGLENVRSYIQSGNVVFDSDLSNLEPVIQNKIKEAFNIECKVLLLDYLELKKLVDKSPYKNMDAKSQHFFFLKDSPNDIDLSKFESIKAIDEEFTVTDRVFYLLAPSGIGRSKLAAKVEKILGVVTTARNRNTINKILTMCEN
ncbi:MAG: DUF1697 domain-containing protein [Candidatus Cloacimonetes bacterium]|nr:DUF1697 domain-containing protein [Candidatus Cloacimonadota bacterium]